MNFFPSPSLHAIYFNMYCSIIVSILSQCFINLRAGSKSMDSKITIEIKLGLHSVSHRTTNKKRNGKKIFQILHELCSTLLTNTTRSGKKAMLEIRIIKYIIAHIVVVVVAVIVVVAFFHYCFHLVVFFFFSHADEFVRCMLKELNFCVTSDNVCLWILSRPRCSYISFQYEKFFK